MKFLFAFLTVLAITPSTFAIFCSMNTSEQRKEPILLEKTVSATGSVSLKANADGYKASVLAAGQILILTLEDSTGAKSTQMITGYSPDLKLTFSHSLNTESAKAYLFCFNSK